jgi:hypothetical protein
MDTQQAMHWWARHPVDPVWVAHYAASEAQPHRADVVAALGRVPGWSSLFEIGCHCGPMLHAIQAAFPAAMLSGCDVNQEAVTAARQWLPGVVCGPFPGVTAAWPDQSVDVVLSCYALASADPGDLDAALTESARIARRAVVICEPVAWDGWTGMHRNGEFVEWRHPYLSLLTQSEAYRGWRATCEHLHYEANRLSGLITVERP